MSNNFTLNAVARDLEGKGASRRLRRSNLVPAIIYGGDTAPQSISISFKELVKVLESEAFYSQVISLTVDGKAESVILKALQRHPAKNVPTHADFLRVDANQAVTVRVPLHFINQDTAVGVKQQGGAVSVIATDVEISSLPSNIPEFIEVDMAAVELGSVVHLSDIKLPEGVSIPELAQGADHDHAIANIHAVHTASDDAADDADDAAPEAAE